MLLAFFILKSSYLNKILAVEQTPLKSASFVYQNSVGLPKLFHINRIDERFSPQTALCGIVDAYNRRNVKKNCTAVQFFSFYERTA